ncbi:acyltransferase [Flavobacterium sp. SH_e]|uniref:acyltransferase family protein n=1 Tax=Flavobacterium TaxID=237 RepID=UPI0021E3F2C9|nr:acyltransferase [Flavobacterium sp. SH_e]MCV2483986.1 acyltransferase [Flavobacterium sp. SH_e]
MFDKDKISFSALSKSLKKENMKIKFLDGIRGYSALIVVIYHSYLFTYFNNTISKNEFLNNLLSIIKLGYLSVGVFIILSGFCLAIPVVNNEMNFQGGIQRYFKRRFRRIVPPYYVALILSIIIIITFPVLQVNSNTNWDSKIPINFENIGAHFLLIHNLKTYWISKINGAHWSVALEWQIYFLFPIMLFIWKKANWLISLSITFIFSYFVNIYLPFTRPQYIVLFFLGLLSAFYTFNNEHRLKFNKYFFLFLIILFAIALVIIKLKVIPEFYSEIILGLSISFLLNQITFLPDKNIFIIFFSSKISAELGKISYSLYLIHGPILALVNLLLLKYFNIKYEIQLLIMWFVITPLTVFLSKIFYELVESKFLNNKN